MKENITDFIPLSVVKKYDRFEYGDAIIEATGLHLGSSGSKVFKIVEDSSNFDKHELYVFSYSDWPKKWRDGEIKPIKQTATNPAVLELLEDARCDPNFLRVLYDSLVTLYQFDSPVNQEKTIELLREVLPEDFRRKLNPKLECDMDYICADYY